MNVLSDAAHSFIEFKKSAPKKIYHFFCIPLTIDPGLMWRGLTEIHTPQHDFFVKINTCSQRIPY